MVRRKDTYKYVVKVGPRTVYVGVTADFDRRAQEHRRRWPSATISKVGSATTRDRALAWEVKRVKTLGSSTAASVKDTIIAHLPVRGGKKRVG